MNRPDNADLQYVRSLPGVEQLIYDLRNKSDDVRNVNFLCYDITLLRKINHAYGRTVGDALLAAVAQWVLGFPGGALYRIEGDCFCVLFKDVDMKSLSRYANALEVRFGEVWHLNINGKSIDVFTQASIAILGDLERDYTLELPNLFERALEVSRKNGQITIFNAEHDQMAREHVRLQMELKTCILSDMRGFDVFYQPLADPVTGTWRGLEALCRWTGPTIGPVPPGIFIQEAEDMGLIHQLGTWVLDTALGTCKELGLEHIGQFFVSVNVSASQLTKRNYARTVLRAVEKHQYPCHKLLLEITESTQFTFNETTMAAIDQLRAEGVMFALDDFGSGYSGFSNLKNLPVDMLKTDREFIDNIENDSYLQYFYYIMSETAHANGMHLIAEGIETGEQLRSVVKNGADLIQGYYFGRPMNKQAVQAHRANFTRALDEFSGHASGMADFQHWLSGQDAYKITPSLFRLQSQSIRLMLDETDLDSAMNKILETVGTYFKVNRVYVFLRDEGKIFSNRYEWCAEGVASQIHLFQKVDGALDGFYEVLRENEVIIATNPAELPQNLQERLQTGGQQGSIQAMVVMPMKQRGEILGFVGFDDQTAHDWTPEELIILHNLCLLCLVILAKNSHR